MLLAMAAVLCVGLMSGCGKGKGGNVPDSMLEGGPESIAEGTPGAKNEMGIDSGSEEEGSEGSSKDGSGKESGEGASEEGKGGSGDEKEKSDDDVIDLTIPADFVGQDVDQATVDLIVEKNGWISGKYNEADDTVTYYMTRKQYNELIEKTKAEIRKNLQDFVDSKKFPGVTKVEASEDFREFKVYCENKETSAGYGAFLYICQAQAATYGIIVGEEMHVHVDFIEESTGEVFESYDSND
jgi:hypothetical protein